MDTVNVKPSSDRHRCSCYGLQPVFYIPFHYYLSYYMVYLLSKLCDSRLILEYTNNELEIVHWSVIRRRTTTTCDEGQRLSVEWRRRFDRASIDTEMRPAGTALSLPTKPANTHDACCSARTAIISVEHAAGVILMCSMRGRP